MDRSKNTPNLKNPENVFHSSNEICSHTESFYYVAYATYHNTFFGIVAIEYQIAEK